MEDLIVGRTLIYGDDINTDVISPPQYMELSIEDAAPFAMGGVDQNFSAKVKSNSILVVGSNFGSGSSRETAPLSLKYLGVQVIIARSFARIFYRNAINVGLLIAECEQVDHIETNDQLTVDILNGNITNITKNESYRCGCLPKHILDICLSGGLVCMLQQRFGRA